MHFAKSLLLGALCGTATLAWGQSPGAVLTDSATAVATNRAEEVVARVGKTVIARRDLEMAMRGILIQMAQRGRGIGPEQRGRFEHDVLEEMIGRELLLQDAQGKPMPGLDKKVDDQLAAALKEAGGEEGLTKSLSQAGLTREEFKKRMRDNLQVQLSMEALVDTSIQVPAAEVREFYDANPARFRKPEVVRASHILITVPRDASDEIKTAKRTQIEAARALVKGGEKFAEVARKVSECPSSRQGGDLGTFSRGKMVPEFELAAFELKPNELSEVVTTPFGYHLILVTERQAAETVAFEKVQPRIEAMLKERKGVALVREHIKQLRAKTAVEVLLPAPPAPAQPEPLSAPGLTLPKPAPASP